MRTISRFGALKNHRIWLPINLTKINCRQGRYLGSSIVWFESQQGSDAPVGLQMHIKNRANKKGKSGPIISEAPCPRVFANKKIRQQQQQQQKKNNLSKKDIVVESNESGLHLLHSRCKVKCVEIRR